MPKSIDYFQAFFTFIIFFTNLAFFMQIKTYIILNLQCLITSFHIGTILTLKRISQSWHKLFLSPLSSLVHSELRHKWHLITQLKKESSMKVGKTQLLVLLMLFLWIESFLTVCTPLDFREIIFLRTNQPNMIIWSQQPDNKSWAGMTYPRIEQRHILPIRRFH